MPLTHDIFVYKVSLLVVYFRESFWHLGVFVVLAHEYRFSLQGYANLLVKLIRRYKYLERSLEESFGKVRHSICIIVSQRAH